MWRKVPHLLVPHSQANDLCRSRSPNIISRYMYLQSTDRRSTPQSPRSFKTMMEERRYQAQHTVVITSANEHYDQMMEKCLQYGSLRAKVFRHDNAFNSIFLLNFTRITEARELIRSAGYAQSKFDDVSFLSNGRFLVFQPNGKLQPQRRRRFELPELESKLNAWPQILATARLKQTNDEQIKTIFELGAISELSTRLRFLTALQIEEAIGSIASSARVLPFGSSVNGFGRMSSDLDMVLTFGGQSDPANEIRFISAMKQSYRPAIHLNVLSKILSTWLPGITKLEEILAARIPILKYYHNLTGLHCDLSMGNKSGVHMSELMYNLCQADFRVQPLVVFIRQWAQMFNVSAASQPSACLTNFMLTCLVVSFLQHSQLLPPTSTLLNAERPHKRSENTDQLSTLLVEFFRYYSKFDFRENALSIAEGITKKRTRDGAIEIVNPLDANHNVGAVVGTKDRDYFIKACEYGVEALADKEMSIVQFLDTTTTKMPKAASKDGSQGRRAKPQNSYMDKATMQTFVADMMDDQHKKKNDNKQKAKKSNPQS